MSALSVAVGRRFVRTLTSPALREARRVGHDWRRRLSGREAVVHYFHQPGDPYSALVAGLLPALRASRASPSLEMRER